MSSILKETKDNILYITLNRPDSLNAFTTEMLMELQSAVYMVGHGEGHATFASSSSPHICAIKDTALD